MTTKQANQCPNQGPGRYEGQGRPCITAAFDGAQEYASDSLGDCDQSLGAVDFFQGPFATAADLPDLSFEPCRSCLKSLPFFGAALYTNGQGFRSLITFEHEGQYLATIKSETAEYEAAEALADLEA